MNKLLSLNQETVKMTFLMRTAIMLSLLSFSSYSNLQGQEFKYKKKLGKFVYKSSEGLDYDKQYDEVVSYYDGTWKVANDGKWGIINSQGELIVNVEYEQIDGFLDKHAIVKKDGKYGVINKQGEEVLKANFDRIDHYAKGKCVVKKDGVWGEMEEGDFYPIKGEIVFRNPDEKPMLKSCIGKEENCTTQELFRIIFANMEYPKSAIQNGIEGTVVTEIIIGKDGNLEEVNVLREIGGGCDEESVRLVRSYATDWQPGKQEGARVKSRFVFPIRFKLE